MGNNSQVEEALLSLGLSEDEVKIYLSLVKGQKNHLDISRDTGIARSNVYRIVDELIEKGVVHEVTTDEDKVLEGADVKALELLVVAKETEAKQKREIFNQVLPLLGGLVNQDEAFSIKNYNGISGMKQMLWNELSAKGEICIFSCGNLDKATGKNFAEEFRRELMRAGIVQRALENLETDNPTISEHEDYRKHYLVRGIGRDIIEIKIDISIHDDTVSIYNDWTNNTQIGTEIKNPHLADFMRQVFEHYWKLVGA